MSQRVSFCLLALVALSTTQNTVYAQTASVTVTSSTPNNSVYFKYTGTGGEVIDVEYEELIYNGSQYVPSGIIIAERMTQVNHPFFGIYLYHEKTATGGLPKNKLYQFRMMKIVGGVGTQVWPGSGWGVFGTGP